MKTIELYNPYIKSLLSHESDIPFLSESIENIESALNDIEHDLNAELEDQMLSNDDIDDMKEAIAYLEFIIGLRKRNIPLPLRTVLAKDLAIGCIVKRIKGKGYFDIEIYANSIEDHNDAIIIRSKTGEILKVNKTSVLILH